VSRSIGLLPPALGVLLTTAAYLPHADSAGAAALAGAGLLGCLPWRAPRSLGVTLTGAAALGQLALHSPSPAIAVAVAVLLALLLAAAEAVESGRWSAGWRAMLSAHAVPVCLGVAVAAAGVLVGLAGPHTDLTPWVAAIIGLVAAAAGIAVLLSRLAHGASE
jgi:hypothetical protein